MKTTTIAPLCLFAVAITGCASAPSVPHAATGPTRELPVRDGSGAPIGDVAAELVKEREHFFARYRTSDGVSEPRSCVQWEVIRARGLEPIDNAEAQGHDAAQRLCRPLALLKGARPARQSFVEALSVSLDLSTFLPAKVAPAVSSESAAAIAAASANGLSWKQATPTLRRLEDEGDGVYDDGAMRTELRIEAYGDFDGDGVEDALFTAQHKANGGTLHVAHTIIVTRATPDGVLRVVHAE